MKLDKVIGNFPTFYKQAVLANLTQHLTRYHNSGITFYNFHQGQVGFQLKESHLHKDAVWLYKWLRSPVGARMVPETIEHLRPWLKAFAEVNEDVPMDKFGFPKDLYLPGNDLIVHSMMRATDRLEIYEPRPYMNDLLTQAIGHDPRVRLHTDDKHDKEDYFIQNMPCRTGHALIYIDINQNSTYIQQLRAKNALHAILKRFPTASFLVTWDQHGEHMPWDAMEAFAQTGYNFCHASVQYAEKDYAERKVLESITANYQGIPEHAEAALEQGFNTSQFGVIETGDDSEWWPDSIQAFKPGKNWEGAGAAVLNVPADYDGTLQSIGEGLRDILNKPNGMVYGRSSPLFEPSTYAKGGGNHEKMSYRNPGISLPETYQYASGHDVKMSIDRQFSLKVVPRLDYVPFTGGPKDPNEAAAEPFKLTEQGRRLIETRPRRAPAHEKRKASNASLLDTVHLYLDTHNNMKCLDTIKSKLDAAGVSDEGYAYKPGKQNYHPIFNEREPPADIVLGTGKLEQYHQERAVEAVPIIENQIQDLKKSRAPIDNMVFKRDMSRRNAPEL